MSAGSINDISHGKTLAGNQPSGSRARATHNYYEQEEPIQVARTLAAQTPENRADEYLRCTCESFMWQ